MIQQLFTGSLISDRIAVTGGRASGFDYMRFVLAAAVILFHSVVTSYGAEQQARLNASELGPIVGAILPLFFSLSGFLVAGSLERSRSLGIFLGLRVLRIFPALTVDTLFCALLLGPVLTTLTLHDYLASPEFHAYFLNIVGNIHFTLPGVFQQNPSGLVNGQLWTIPVELECYVAITVLALFGLHRHRTWMLALVGLGLVALEGRVLLGISTPWSGRLLLLCFLCGVLCFQFRDRLRLTLPAFVVALLAGYVCLRYQSLIYLAAIPVTYVTVCVGLRNPAKSGFLESGDYSYGLFLYGYPIQQTVVAYLPWAREWYWNSLVALPIALLFSMMSWHFVEKRVMARKPLLFAAHAKGEQVWRRMRASLGTAPR